MQTTSPEEVATARRIMVWKDFVPDFLRFPLMLLIIIIFMLSGGIYMSAVSEISGSFSWIKEDILMAGYASMTGLTMAFPLLFRILFRFPTRSILLVSAVAFIVCDYVCMVCQYLPLVVLMSFISGFFRILSTFVCWSNLQLRITPNRDFAVFFPFLFTFILGSVQLTDIVTGYSISAFEWRAMHRLTIGAFILVFALVYFCMRRGYRQAPYIPFKGIDYLGGILWSLWLICIIFILVYGEHYDWLDSEEIRTAIVFAVILLVMCLERAASIRHPYISLKTFSQRNMLFIFILFGCMSLMSTMVSSVQNIYTSMILGFDARHNADLCWGSRSRDSPRCHIFLHCPQKMEMANQKHRLHGLCFVLAVSNPTLFSDRCLDREIYAIPAHGLQGSGSKYRIYIFDLRISRQRDICILFRGHVCDRFHTDKFRRAAQFCHNHTYAQPYKAGCDSRFRQLYRLHASDVRFVYGYIQ